MSTEFVSALKSSAVLRSSLLCENWIKFYENKFYRIRFYRILLLLGLVRAAPAYPIPSLSVNLLFKPPQLDKVIPALS